MPSREGSSTFYNAITLYGSAPTISNGIIADTGSAAGGTEAAIGADLDSFLTEDATPDGPLIRGITVENNNLNGLWLIAESNGFIESTNSMPNIPTNPSTLGGSENYTFFEPLPFVVITQLVVGQELLENTGGLIQWVPNRLYIDPGVMMKFNSGSPRRSQPGGQPQRRFAVVHHGLRREQRLQPPGFRFRRGVGHGPDRALHVDL